MLDPRLRLGLAAFCTGLNAYGLVLAQECVDYADYIRSVGSVDTPGTARGVVVAGNHAYVADWESGLQVIDIGNSTSPQIAGSVDTPGAALGVAVAGNYAYITDADSGFHVIDGQQSNGAADRRLCRHPG